MMVSDDEADTICRMGKGALCCRYLILQAAEPAGLACAKHTELRVYLDERVADGSIVARGDNCPGKSGPT
jgi:hypothetical protein